jgi:hypothetical protein
MRIIVLEKPGTGIFLMKESAKLHKEQKERKTFTVSKRLWSEVAKEDPKASEGSAFDKRMNLGGGQMQQIPASQNSQSEQKKK